MGLSILRLIKATFLAASTVIIVVLLSAVIIYVANTISFLPAIIFFMFACSCLLIKTFYEFLG